MFPFMLSSSFVFFHDVVTLLVLCHHMKKTDMTRGAHKIMTMMMMIRTRKKPGRNIARRTEDATAIMRNITRIITIITIK